MSKTTFTAETGKHEIVMTRTFDAPREQVFAVYTDPKSIPNWWGPSWLTTTIDKFEPRQGGVWRFVQHDKAGNEYGFHGVHHEITAPSRLVRTFEFEGMPGHVLLETVVFEDVGGKTRIVAQSVFQSVEARDGMVQSGAEAGAVESWDRLAALLSA